MVMGKVGEATGAVEALDLSGLLSDIQDEVVRDAIVRLMNLVEQLAAENWALREVSQRLRDENNRRKGQSPRPSSAGGKGGTKPRQDYSSE